jgi:predicted transcriptional regulator
VRTVSDKVWTYLVEHKRPVTKDKIADHYLVSKDSVQRVLGDLTRKQVLDRIQVGTTFLYKIKD